MNVRFGGCGGHRGHGEHRGHREYGDRRDRSRLVFIRLIRVHHLVRAADFVPPLFGIGNRSRYSELL